MLVIQALTKKTQTKKKKMKLHQSTIKNVDMADDVTIIEPCNLYECTLHENVFVGPFSEIQNGVIVGSHTRIQSHSFICEKVIIGDNCFIGHGVMFTNDLFKEGYPDADAMIETNIGNNVSIGSNATILPINICDGVVIGAGSVVTKNITTKGVYAGNPARLLRTLD